MRFKYYKISLRQMGMRKPFVLFCMFLIVISIIILIFSYINKITPIMKDVCESNANSVSIKILNEAVYEYIDGLEYEDFVNIQKDDKGNIKSITANTSRINKMTSDITNKLMILMKENEESYVNLPLGSLSGTNLLAGFGPKIKVKSMPTGVIQARLDSSFTSVGINQTKHTLSLDVTINMRVMAPFFTDVLTYNSKIMIAETVIVGNIPDLYYDNFSNNQNSNYGN